ncbi:hypothetical protein D3C86_2236860 [compost metagenome]
MANTSLRRFSAGKAQKPALAAMSTTARVRLITTRNRKNSTSEWLARAPIKAAANIKVAARITL